MIFAKNRKTKSSTKIPIENEKREQIINGQIAPSDQAASHESFLQCTETKN